MKKLEINISKAALTGFNVTLSGDTPALSATIGLYTEGGKLVTVYTASTDAWREADKMTLPIDAMKPLFELARIVEGAAVKHTRDQQLGISAGEPEVLAADEPINLDNVPF